MELISLATSHLLFVAFIRSQAHCSSFMCLDPCLRSWWYPQLWRALAPSGLLRRSCSGMSKDQGLIVLIIFCGVGSSDCLVCGSVQCTILILGIWWVCPPRRYLWCLRRFTALVRSWIKGIGERVDQWR